MCVRVRACVCVCVHFVCVCVHMYVHVCVCVCTGTPVLVHGADGTDTTLLVTSLSQLILDKDCRTVSGSVNFDISAKLMTSVDGFVSYCKFRSIEHTCI